MSAPLALTLARYASPIDEMLLIWDDELRLRVADFQDYEARMKRLLKTHYGMEGQGYIISEATLPEVIHTPLDAYFAGNLAAIDAIPVATNGSDFQRQIWDALRDIPAGSTLSYGALAVQIGNPKAVRAVGLANGANPIAIIVPCHRVIGANGSLTGYGGGLPRKQWLLAHEGALPARLI